MSSYMRGRGRGGMRGSMGFRGRGMRPHGYAPRSRGGGFGDRSISSDHHHRSMSDRSSSYTHSKSRGFNTNMGSRDDRFTLTKSLVDSVLKNENHSDRHGNYSERRDSSYGSRKYKTDGRPPYMRDEPEARPMRRPNSDRPHDKYERFKDDGGYDQYERKRPQDMGRHKPDSSDKYARGGLMRKRPAHFEQSYPPFKKQRNDGSTYPRPSRGRPMKDSFPRKEYHDDRSNRGSFRNHYNKPHPLTSHKYEERPRKPYDMPPKRFGSGGGHKMDTGEDGYLFKKTRKTYQDEPPARRSSSYGDKEKPYKSERRDHERIDDDSHHNKRRSADSFERIPRRIHEGRPRREFPQRSDMRVPFKGKPRGSSMRDVQVTVKRDGLRAVNSEGYVRSSSRFIDLQCPHCPDERIITFTDYKYHLDSKEHKKRLDNLSFKHSGTLRNIRLQQRTSLREMEDQWKEEEPEDFETLTTKYCDVCKLAYKAPDAKTKKLGTTFEKHNDTKFHKMQAHYLNPRCSLCKMEFSSRMIYEHHIASIRHLKMQAQRAAEREIEEETTVEKENEELDLKDFITMDSVGDEEVGSEHGDITGRLEDVKAAEEEAKTGDDDENEEGDAEEEEGKIPSEMEMEYHEDDLKEDEDLDLDNKELTPIGLEFVVPVEAVYCKVCHIAIRTDLDGVEEATNKHCKSKNHNLNYHYMGDDEMADQLMIEEDEEELGGAEEGEGFEEDEDPFEDDDHPEGYEEEEYAADGMEVEEEEMLDDATEKETITRVVRNDRLARHEQESTNEEENSDSLEKTECDREELTPTISEPNLETNNEEDQPNNDSCPISDVENSQEASQ